MLASYVTGVQCSQVGLRHPALGRTGSLDQEGQDMSGLMIGLIVWSVLTGFLIILMIYRASLLNHEDYHLFLSNSQSSMAQEQAELLVRLNKLEPVIKSIAWASGILLVGLGGFWVYQSLQAPTVL